MRTLCKILTSAALIFITANPLLAGGEHPAPQPTLSSRSTQPQTHCPVMGGPIDKALYVDAKGKRIYLCCAACEDAVRAEPEKYLRKLEQRGESAEDSPVTAPSSTPNTEKAHN